MKEFLCKIANIGIDDNTSFGLRNKLRVFNNANIVILFISIFYNVIAFANHFYLAVLLTYYSIFSNTFSLYMVHRKKYNFAFHYTMWYGFIFLSAFSILLGKVNNSYYYFLFMPVAANIFFDDKRVSIFYFISSAVAMIINVFYVEHYEPYYTVEDWMAYLSYPNIAFACLLVFLGVRLFKLENIRYSHQIEEQHKILEEKNHEITDSINYAKRLQEAILPPISLIQKYLLQTFILYKPKDIVAGDFYWMEIVNNKEMAVNNDLNSDNLHSVDCILIAAADSTGHGVPGAMVSVVCSNALNRSVNEFKITEPGKILDKTRDLVLETFSKSESEVKDGMDISLLSIQNSSNQHFKNDKIHIKWAGANNPLWYIEGGELKQIKAHKQSIGKTDNPTPFPTHTLELERGSIIYLITDGFADQFGGENGKKFKHKKLQELLIKTQFELIEEQKTELEIAFNKWKGKIEQVDDVTIIGIKL